MGTVPRQKVTGTVLPPPPAPTSRDANPWPMSATRVPPRLPGLQINPVTISKRLKGPPPVPKAAPNVGGPLPSKVRLLPFLVLGAVFLGAGLNALESFRAGDYFGAFVPFIVVGFIAFGAMRSLLRK